jgi:hypothetical protein
MRKDAASYAVNEKYNKQQIELEKKKVRKKEINQEANKNRTKSRENFFKSEKEIGGDATGKKTASTTSTIDDFINAEDPFNVKSSSDQGKQGPTGGTKKIFPEGTERSLNSKIQRYLSPTTNATTKGRLFDEISDILRKAGFPQNKINKFFIDVLQVNPKAVDPIFKQGDLFGKFKYDKSTATSGGKSKGDKPVKVKPKRGSGFFSKLPFSSTLSKSLSKPAFGTEPIKLLKAIRKSGLIKGVKTYAPGKLKTVLFGVDLALTGSAEMDSISKISLRNNIVTALFDLLGPASNVNRMAEILNEPGLLIPKVYQGQEGTYIYRDNKIINENIRKIKESNKKDFTMSDIYKGVTGDAEILNRIMHGKKDVPKIETIPKIRPSDKYDFSDEYSSDVNIFSDLQELKGRK